MLAYTKKHLTHSEKLLIPFFIGFLGNARCRPSPTCIHKAGFSPLSASITCSNSLKSTNLPAAAAVMNLVGIVGIVPLSGARCMLEGPGWVEAAARFQGCL